MNTALIGHVLRAADSAWLQVREGGGGLVAPGMKVKVQSMQQGEGNPDLPKKLWNDLANESTKSR
jgi:hypothetical protein